MGDTSRWAYGYQLIVSNRVGASSSSGRRSSRHIHEVRHTRLSIEADAPVSKINFPAMLWYRTQVTVEFVNIDSI
jgi:hypothetical protein